MKGARSTAPQASPRAPALVELERDVVELCFGPEPSVEQCRRLGDERIWRIYRESIRNRLRSELKVALKRTHAAAGDAFERAFGEFLQQAPPRTRYFHAVVGCFAESACASFAHQPDAPRYLADLCAYEAALWAVSDLPDAMPAGLAQFTFDREPVLAPALALLALGHAVHAEPDAQGAYECGEVYLCVHRRADEKKARTFRMNAVMFELMQRFSRGGQSVTTALQQVAAQREIAIDEPFVDGLCTVLSDFIERGIILGAR
jgi:hypothetical protein